jgi:PAS domain S-box-containing protein
VSQHAVRFYEHDSVLIEGLSEFVGAALGGGDACIVIATQKHHRSLNSSLRDNAIDIHRIASEGRYVPLDAQETLARFMVNGHPDRAPFRATIEPVLERTKRTMRRDGGALAAFGEMVAILWAEGRREAAVELEHLWNDLAMNYRFNLLCAYPIDGFAREADAGLFNKICAQHTEVVPTESYTSLSSQDDRSRMISSLQQKASTVQAALEAREKEAEQRKVVEEKLRRSEEFTRNIIESSVDCVKVLDLQGRIQYMSPSGQRALEINNTSEFLNKNWVDFWKAEDRQRAENALAAARRGEVGCFQGDSTTPAGIRKSWDVRVAPALARNGEIERLVAVSRDITELRNVQQLAIQAEKLAAAGRLAATIAHEINNPLEAVTNFIYLAMTAKGLPAEVCRHLEIADRELARVARIAQQTLGFYRDNSKDRWIRLSDLMHDVMIVYERKLAYKHLETEVSVDPELTLCCKQGELRQALSNLVANAIDASRDRGKIWLRAHQSTRWNDGGEAGVRITLADNGAGMSPDVQKRIFVPFFTTKAEIGTGIGLWATRTLIEQQGGFLRFRSRQGMSSGTVMSIYLPKAHSAEGHREGGHE